MADLAKYVRIYDPAPSDDDVTKREAAIKDAVSQLRKLTQVGDLVKLGAATAETFATGNAASPLGETVAVAIKKHASAFVREERELEVAVVGAVTIIALLDGPETTNTVTVKDVVAATLWSALSFQQPLDDAKFEQLRQDLLGAARDRCLLRAESSRRRSPPAKDLPEASTTDLTATAKALNAAVSTIEILKNNAVLDREELDVLWWALGGRSPTTGTPYDDLAPDTRGLVRGIELGAMLRRVPAQAHRNLALSNVPPTEPKSLPALIADISATREVIAARLPGASYIKANPVAFPMLSSIITGDASGGPMHTGDDWTARAILETGLAAICETPNAKV